MHKLPPVFKICLGIFLVTILLLFGFGHSNFSIKKLEATVKNTKTSHDNSVLSKQQVENKKTTAPIDWLKPTGGAYPVLGPNDPIWIKVSKEKQRVYIMKGNKIMYTMVCSTGLDTNPDTSTPEGTFHIQQEKGKSFYNGSEKEGAKYWVSWKNHGEFLFHSVATDKNGNVIKSEAMKLGHKASHGCVRLAVPDAKWIYDNISYNTKVVIS
jgi:lipoprotein-anchoring transpeptidase ErfK/SrfK